MQTSAGMGWGSRLFGKFWIATGLHALSQQSAETQQVEEKCRAAMEQMGYLRCPGVSIQRSLGIVTIGLPGMASVEVSRQDREDYALEAARVTDWLPNQMIPSQPEQVGVTSVSLMPLCEECRLWENGKLASKRVPEGQLCMALYEAYLAATALRPIMGKRVFCALV